MELAPQQQQVAAAPATTTTTMNYHDYAFIDVASATAFDITEQLNAYNESLMMNSNATPDLAQPQEEEEQQQQQQLNNPDFFAIDNVDDVDDYNYHDDDEYQAVVYNSLYEESPNANPNYHHRPLSGYNLFLRDHGNGRSKTTLVLQGRKPPTMGNDRNGSMPPTMPEMMAQAWNGLSPAARAHYQGLAQQERNEYLAAIKKKKEMLALQVVPTTKATIDSGSSNNMMMMAMNTNQTTMPLPLPPVQAPQLTMLPPQPQQQQHNNSNLLPVHGNNLLPPMEPNAASATTTTDLAFMTPNYRRAIADLASKLDDPSIDFLIRAFK